MLRLVALAIFMLAALLGTMVALSAHGSALDSLYAARPPHGVQAVAAGGVITVTSTLDEVNDDGNCSLREAIAAAETDAVVDGCPAGNVDDTVYIPAGRYVLFNGQLVLTGTVTLQGSLTATTILDGYNLYNVVKILPDATVTLRRLNITNGGGSDYSSYPFVGDGGGVANYGTTRIIVSAIYENQSDYSGIMYSAQGGDGGGIYNRGVLTISNSTISDNKAADGLLVGNRVECSWGGKGGGIANLGVLRLENVTLTNNQAGKDGLNEAVCYPGGVRSILVGGLYNGVYEGVEGTVTIQNSIITDNDGSDCGGAPITSLGNNLLRTTTECTIHGEYLRWGAHLGPLQENGGSTLTHALGPKSPAIDAGSCLDSVGITVTVDQRGGERPLGDGCDIGAFESPYTLTFAISTTSLPLIGYQPAPCAEIVTPCNLTNNPKSDVFATWSPDGKHIAFVRYEGDASIYRMNADGSGVMLLTDDGEQPLWSPDGSKIAFLRRGVDLKSDIYVMEANGTQPTNITNSALTDERNKAWSPDGTMLLFESVGKGVIVSELYLMRADGSQKRKVVDNGIISTSPWSPDGGKFVYSVPNESFQFRVIDVDGSNPISFEFPGERVYVPAWSPDGNWIAYVCVKESVSQICRMRSDGSQRSTLTQGAAEVLGPVLWSPDGSKLLFLHLVRNSGVTLDLAVIPAAGGEATLLTHGEIDGYATEPRWSPDGSKILFATSTSGNSEIYVVGVAE